MLHTFQTAVGEDLQLKCAERSCPTLEMAVETLEIQERYTKKAVRALKQEESEIALYLEAMGKKLEALMGEIKDDQEQRKTGRRRKADMECHSCHQKGNFARECPTKATEGRSGEGSRRRHNRRGAPGGCGDGGDGHGGEQTIFYRADRGEQGQLLGRHGIWGVDPGHSDLEEVGSCRR